MSIVSSTYEVDSHTQVDGRRYVREFHTDSVGIVHQVEYLAVDGTDYQSVANARSIVIASVLVEQETETIING